MMRHMAHSCVAFSAENDAEATPMRHRFGQKRRPNRRDGEKARWRRRLAVAAGARKWRILCTRHAQPGLWRMPLAVTHAMDGNPPPL
jgi:hypothetical protein